MLNNIPERLSALARQVVIRHPNAIPAFAFRRVLTRVDETGGVLGGAPLFGGVADLDSDEDAEFDLEDLGEAYFLPLGAYEPAAEVDRGDAIVQGAQFECRIEPADFEDDGFIPEWSPKKGDIIVVLIGQDVRLPYSISNVSGGVNIPPYTRKFLVEPRDDLRHAFEKAGRTIRAKAKVGGEN